MQAVFSTYVEVILSIDEFAQKYASFLHVCGGDPAKDNEELSNS